ncbi:hypothetical protein MRB53_028283 [Persea americana]|uniref:Uncharacterized protein n=1 Tax=Persea americana TaxID=3435 RepID=A0ACC2KFM9_PERAE|nr:hypothetical protein MRB53_028283 [Persea americana]
MGRSAEWERRRGREEARAGLEDEGEGVGIGSKTSPEHLPVEEESFEEEAMVEVAFEESVGGEGVGFLSAIEEEAGFVDEVGMEEDREEFGEVEVVVDVVGFDEAGMELVDLV